MNSTFSDKVSFARRYIHFLRHASTRYAVHSPYIYQLVSEVIRPGAPAGICSPVETLREGLIRDKRTILKTDFGSGGEQDQPGRYSVKLSHIARYSSLPSYRAARLFRLVRFIKARNVLELGTSLGISTAYLAKGGPEARIVTLEGCPEVASLARENLQKLNLPHVQVVEGSFDQTLAEVLKSFDGLDLVFFDGNHRREPTLDYFNQCLSLSHNDSIFVFDDIHYSKEMERAWEEIIKREEVTVSIDLFHMGLVIFRKELTHQHFILRYP